MYHFVHRHVVFNSHIQTSSRITCWLLRYSRHVCLNIHLAKGKHRTFRRCRILVEDPTRISCCGSTTILDTRGAFLFTFFNIASFMTAHLELSAAMDESTYSHSSARIFLQVSVTQIAWGCDNLLQSLIRSTRWRVRRFFMYAPRIDGCGFLDLIWITSRADRKGKAPSSFISTFLLLFLPRQISSSCAFVHRPLQIQKVEQEER